MIKFSISQLFNYNVHLGQLKNRWNPKNAIYIYGNRNNVSILNLEVTFYMLKRALMFISEVIRLRGILLSINLKPGTYKYNMLNIKKFGQYFITGKYVGGLLTNFKNVKTNYSSLLNMLRLPNVVFLSNLNNCVPVVKECVKLSIPLVGIIDSNINPEYFNYPIPGNSESIVSTKLYYNLLYKAVFTGLLKQRVKYLKIFRRKR